MRHRLSTIAVLLLAAVMVLAGCQRAAEVRAPESTDEETAARSTAVEVLPTAATVVSAVTIAPSGQATPTAAVEGGLPTVAVPTETVVLPTAVVPTAEPQATTAPSGDAGEGYVWYTVEQGDTLAGIAQEYGTTVTAIAQANSLTDPNQITAGQKLKVPTSTGSTGGSTGGTTDGTGGCRYRHTVARGEWIWQIARNYGVDPYDILKANGLTIDSAGTIYPGMVLCIP